MLPTSTILSKADITANQTSTVDNLIAFKILTLLTTKVEDFEAFKLGIIDTHYNVIKPYESLTRINEKMATNYLLRLVFSIKKIFGKMPNNNWYFRSMGHALNLIKESYNHPVELSLFEEQFLLSMNLPLLNEGTVIDLMLDGDMLNDKCV